MIQPFWEATLPFLVPPMLLSIPLCLVETVLNVRMPIWWEGIGPVILRKEVAAQRSFSKSKIGARGVVGFTTYRVCSRSLLRFGKLKLPPFDPPGKTIPVRTKMLAIPFVLGTIRLESRLARITVRSQLSLPIFLLSTGALTVVFSWHALAAGDREDLIIIGLLAALVAVFWTYLRWVVFTAASDTTREIAELL